MKKRILQLSFVLSLLVVLGSLNSCKSLRNDPATRSERKAIKKTQKQTQKANKSFTKDYNKKYKRQTKIQSDQQRKMIKQSRKKPKNMKSSKRFFLFRWLGI